MDIKDAVKKAVTLAHLREETMVCLFTDASCDFWGAILTQVDVKDFESGSSPILWKHEPLGFYPANSVVHKRDGAYPIRKDTPFVSHARSLRMS
jgi:hypothetical protein